MHHSSLHLSLLLSGIVCCMCRANEHKDVPNDEGLPYCSQVMDEEHFDLREESSADHLQGLGMIPVPSQHKERGLWRTNCIIDKEHSLRFRLKRITGISRLLIPRDLNSHTAYSIRVSILRGDTVYKCNLDYIGDLFFNYTCHDNSSAVIYANAVEIKSDDQWELDDTYQSKFYSNCVAIASPGCVPPALYPLQKLNPAKSHHYEVGDNVSIACPATMSLASDVQRTCQNTGYWSEKTPICLPSNGEWFEVPFKVDDGRKFCSGTNHLSHFLVLDRDYVDVTGVYVYPNPSVTDLLMMEDESNVEMHISREGTFFYRGALRLSHEPSPARKIPINVTDLNKGTIINLIFHKYYWDSWVMEKIVIEAAFYPEVVKMFREASENCAPIEAYRGMPDAYYDYELVLNGSINGLLADSPCKEGYVLSMKSGEEISQCWNGTWTNGTFPRCEVIRTRTPPEVRNATWSYVHDELSHQVRYTCDDGSKSGVLATYDTKRDDWIGVPQCVQHQQRHIAIDESTSEEVETKEEAIPEEAAETSTGWLLYLVIPLSIALVTIAAVLSIVCLRKSRRRNLIVQSFSAAECSSVYLTPLGDMERPLPEVPGSMHNSRLVMTDDKTYYCATPVMTHVDAYSLRAVTYRDPAMPDDAADNSTRVLMEEWPSAPDYEEIRDYYPTYANAVDRNSSTSSYVESICAASRTSLNQLSK